jgi:hypothetical protein
MLLIVEIWLTVKAWRKGWRAKALVPGGILLAAVFLMGVAVEGSGGSIEAVMPLGLLLELACIGVLIRLATRAPRFVPTSAVAETRVATEITAASAKV